VHINVIIPKISEMVAKGTVHVDYPKVKEMVLEEL